MSMMWDKKKAMESIMAKRDPKDGAMTGPAPMQAEVVKSEDGEIDGRHLAAQDALAAIHEKSPEKFMESMKNFMDIHNSMADDDDGDE